MEKILHTASYYSLVTLRGDICHYALGIVPSCIGVPLGRSPHDDAKRIRIIIGFPTLGILLTLGAGQTYPPTSDPAGSSLPDHPPAGRRGPLARPAGLWCPLLLKHDTCIKQSSVLGQYIQKETIVSVKSQQF